MLAIFTLSTIEQNCCEYQFTVTGCACQADKDSMRSLVSSPGYEVTFTLINPQPDVISVTWDVQAAIDSKYHS